MEHLGFRGRLLLRTASITCRWCGECTKQFFSEHGFDTANLSGLLERMPLPGVALAPSTLLVWKCVHQVTPSPHVYGDVCRREGDAALVCAGVFLVDDLKQLSECDQHAATAAPIGRSFAVTVGVCTSCFASSSLTSEMCASISFTVTAALLLSWLS
jgi:hypothetical protein